ncbi:uncharacterized protein LOC144632343 [Oculina patagonica]
MLVGKFWLFIVVAVLLMVTAVFSSEVSEVESRIKWQRARRWFRGSASPSPAPFFAGNTRPEGLPDIARGTEIEQTLPGNTDPYFVSLFDLTENTPFYSAYKVTPAQAADLTKFSRDSIGKTHWRNPLGVPGVDDAYKEAITTDHQPLSRGHLNPLGINTFDTSFMKATFTLTNAVPQFETSNSGDWQIFETRIRDYAQNDCGRKGGTLYLLTGKSKYGLTIDARGQPVQDSTIRLPYPRKTFSRGVKLVTPRAIWTAGCCVWAVPGKVFGMRWPTKRAESFAVMSNNQPNAALLHQTEMSVPDLERLLREPLKEEVNLFPGDGNCRLPANDKVLP